MGNTVRGLHLGYMGLDLGLLADSADNAGVRYSCPVVAYVIETAEGRILWETGISDRFRDEWSQEVLDLVDLDGIAPEVYLPRRLAAVGLGPDDFRYVVLGHLHHDHAGGLRIFEGAGAEIVVHEDEYAHVTADELGPSYSAADWACLGDRTPTLVSGAGTEIAGGVELIHLPGHTPGQMGLKLTLDHSGTVLLTSDALYHHSGYLSDPVAEPQIFWDLDRWRTSLSAVRDIARTEDAWLFPGHDETGIAHYDGRAELRTIAFTPGHVYS